ncbi:MAG: RnfABCDGE type electron transport complex subunit D [Clostridia bacterium]|nr:RnfABCDGE type electron transport complex subunit D [Clostridia bacterium]
MSSLSVSPHIHSGRSTTKIMGDVIISLLPATVAGTMIFGWRTLLVVATCIISSVVFEALFNLIVKKDQTISDLSAVVTGLLLALNLSVNIPLWQCAVGSLFAIVIVKCVFGGIGKNLVNPAITARVFMLIAFSTLATPAFPVGTVDATASATPLTADVLPSMFDLFIGKHGGAIGETSVLALIIGGVYLLIRRVISWHIPATFIGVVFIFSLFVEGFNVDTALSLTMSGGLFIGAIFMATDYTTSPPTPLGKIIFGVGCGLLTGVIRYFGTYPDGVSFAILFMNILTPYICNWTKRKVFTKGGKK